MNERIWQSCSLNHYHTHQVHLQANFLHYTNNNCSITCPLSAKISSHKNESGDHTSPASPVVPLKSPLLIVTCKVRVRLACFFGWKWYSTARPKHTSRPSPVASQRTTQCQATGSLILVKALCSAIGEVERLESPSGGVWLMVSVPSHTYIGDRISTPAIRWCSTLIHGAKVDVVEA
jgi:hypothetical protein